MYLIMVKDMASSLVIVLMVLYMQFVALPADTDGNDLAALTAIKSSWSNLPPNWKGKDPCGSNWQGISCTGSRVTSIMLAGMGLSGTKFGVISAFTELQSLDLSNNIGLKGTLPFSIGNLKKLSILILIRCSFFGPIPDSIGSLPKLVYLSLNSNSFSGPIPPAIGNLANLSWLDLSINQLNGTIPVSNVNHLPGLDMLLNAKHFHLSRNQLSGSIQPALFSSEMKLLHVVLDNNQLTGTIPKALGLVKTLEMVRLDWNFLNGSVPTNLNNLTGLIELWLSNNDLSGSIPNLAGMKALNYLDMSNNSFDPSVFPAWLTSIQSLTTLNMENNGLQGQIPVSFFSLPQLESVVLRNNNLNGTLFIGDAYRSGLELDLQNNSITAFNQSSTNNVQLSLVGNPICKANAPGKYCHPFSNNSLAPSNNCGHVSCSGGKVLSPNCRCSHPYTGSLHFFSYSFSNLANSSYYGTLAGSLISTFRSNGLPVDSVNLSNPSIDVYNYLQFRLQVFPSSVDSFNRTSISMIGFLLNRQPFHLQYFGPFFFIDDAYCFFPGEQKSSNAGTIVGASIGSVVGFLLVIGGGFYGYRRRQRAQRDVTMNNPFASWDPNQGNGAVPQLKGARSFSYEELKKCTQAFSESNCIGFGGYGKVYKGSISSGQSVAIKRAQQGSMQGALEFKTEIELLSRIHHKNVVSLVGFCYDQGEQMLVYEYISNGTLRESISGKSGTRLDWMRRLGIALDAARGLTYLHDLADPPIIHRDVKSNNILLDDHFSAKVADFGLSKLLGDALKGYVTTQVKGTLGYMDPEYYMTQQLTDRSDVYSFGVVLLELITARAPIERGKHIVRLAQEALNNNGSEDAAPNIDHIIDPKLGSAEKHGGMYELVSLAMKCVQESGSERPSMNEAVREIEKIMQLAATVNKKAKAKADFVSFTSSSEETTTDESNHHSYGSKAFEYSGGVLTSNLDHH